MRHTTSRSAVIQFGVTGAIASGISGLTPLGGWVCQWIGLSSWADSIETVMVPLMSLCIGLVLGTLYFQYKERNRHP